MTSTAGGGADIAAHMARYDPIKRSLLIIEGNVTEVHNLQAKNKNTTTEKQRKEVMMQLEKIMDSTNKNGGAIKKQLDEIKKVRRGARHRRAAAGYERTPSTHSADTRGERTTVTHSGGIRGGAPVAALLLKSVGTQAGAQLWGRNEGERAKLRAGMERAAARDRR